MKTQNGFTLVELMITVVVLAILLAVGIPNFRNAIQNNRASTMANELLTSINMARSEAIKRGMRITLCPSTDQATCTVSIDVSKDWSIGWILFADRGVAGTFDHDGDTILCEVDGNNDLIDDCLLRVWDAPKGNPTFTADVNTVQYLASGSPTTTAEFDISFPDASTNQTRKICVTTVGRSGVMDVCPP